jgi:hypothetical protein
MDTADRRATYYPVSAYLSRPGQGVPSPQVPRPAAWSRFPGSRSLRSPFCSPRPPPGAVPEHSGTGPGARGAHQPRPIAPPGTGPAVHPAAYAQPAAQPGTHVAHAAHIAIGHAHIRVAGTGPHRQPVPHVTDAVPGGLTLIHTLAIAMNA